jgi:ketosteroid isomerase-like protein
MRKVSKIDITKKLYASAVAGNWEEFEACVHADFSIRESSALPFGGSYKGVEGFRKLVRTVFTHFQRLRAEPGHYMEGDDYVAAIVSLSGTGKKTGKEFDTTVAELFRFKDGKVIEILPYYWDQQLVNEI